MAISGEIADDAEKNDSSIPIISPCFDSSTDFEINDLKVGIEMDKPKLFKYTRGKNIQKFEVKMYKNCDKERAI